MDFHFNNLTKIVVVGVTLAFMAWTTSTIHDKFGEALRLLKGFDGSFRQCLLLARYGAYCTTLIGAACLLVSMAMGPNPLRAFLSALAIAAIAIFMFEDVSGIMTNRGHQRNKDVADLTIRCISMASMLMIRTMSRRSIKTESGESLDDWMS